MDTPKPTVTYFAVSLFSSRTMQFAALTLIISVLSLPEVMALIPPRFMPFLLAVVAVTNAVLRMVTVRPVALIAPGTTAPVAVAKIDPLPPKTITD